MLITDLLRQFPELTLQSGAAASHRVYRVDVLPSTLSTSTSPAATSPASSDSSSSGPSSGEPAFRPQSGTLYLHSRPEDLPPLEEAQEWLLLTGRPAGGTTLQAGLWLTHPDEHLPLNLSARLLRALYEHQRAGGLEREAQLAELLEELLGGERGRQAELMERAERLGMPLTRARQVLLVALTGPGPGLPPSREQVLREVQRLTASLHARVSVARLSTQTVLLFDPAAISATDLGEQVAQGLTSAFPLHILQVGAGGLVAAASDLPRSYREARAALEVSSSLPRMRRVIHYEDVRHLLIYREIRRNPELLQLIAQTLAPLQSVQGEYGRTMLETLAAYLEHSRSPARAAAALGVHPNTMKYRMKRIGELLDIENLSGRQQALYYLAVHLALQEVRV